MDQSQTITGFPIAEERALEITERVASTLSVLGCFFVIFTFFWSQRFRKPVNRLIFYATLGNLGYNIGTLISIDGMIAGDDSVLCQTQAFLIQAFLPADAFWNLAMAINTYLTVFKKYDAAKCRAMEKWYLLANFGVFVLIAFVYCFIDGGTQGNVKMFGGAVLWCWIRPQWKNWRIITCYGPAWVSIAISFTIYIVAGRRLSMQEKKLAMLGASPSGSFVENPFTSYKTTEIQITTEAVGLADDLKYPGTGPPVELQPKSSTRPYVGSRNDFEEYSITIERRDIPREYRQQRDMNEDEINLRNAAVRTNQAAKSYALCCSLFFLSLLVTWIPSSIFRVYTLSHFAKDNFGMAYSTGLVLPLMGFWNALIYVVISWETVTELFTGKLDKSTRRDWHGHLPRRNEWKDLERDSRQGWILRTRGLSLTSKDDLDPAHQTMDVEGRSWLKT